MSMRALFVGLICLGLFCIAQQPRAQFNGCSAGFCGGVASGGGGGSSITPDVLGTALYQRNSSSFNYSGLTTGTPSNLGLVCIILRAHASNDTLAGLAMTWNGVGLALRASQGTTSNLQSAAIFGLHNPASGAHTLAVFATNSATDNFVNCISFGGVNQTSDALAFPNPANNINVSSLSIISASGHYSVGSFLSLASLGTIIPTILLTDSSSGLIINAGGDYVNSSSGATVVGTSTTQSAMVGVDISP